MAQPASSSYSGIPRATTYNAAPLRTANKTLTKRASVVNFQRPQPWVPANTVTPPLTPQTSDDNLYMTMAPSPQYQQQQQLPHQQQQQQQQQQQPAPFAEYWRAFYGYYPAYDAQSSTVTLPLNAGDLVLVHSIHDNGWADGTLLNSGIRGWFPTNYCEPYDPEPIRNLLKALTTFFDIVRSGAEGNVAVFCNQDYMRGLVAGVRYLLEKMGCLSREAPMVSACLALSRTRKALLSDLSTLVKMAKTLQSELTATHAQPELDESCIDDMVLRAFKLVLRAVKFHDVWLQTVTDEEDDYDEAYDGPGSPQQQRQQQPHTETNRRDSATLSPRQLELEQRTDLAGALTGQSGVGPESQQPAAHRRQSGFAPSSIGSSQTMQQQQQQQNRMSRRPSSLLYSRPQTSQSQTQFSFSNSRPSSLATPGPGNRHSISHRVSYASKLDGVSRENLASERLTLAHENLLTCLGAFIGIHVSSRSSQELLATTQECLDVTEKLTQILRAIWDRGYFGSESIDEIEETMFGHISHLVDAVQGIFNAISQAEDEGMTDVDFPTGDRRQLTDAATNCIRAAGESVSKGRYVLEMIGDFEFELERTRQSVFDGTGLVANSLVEEEDVGNDAEDAADHVRDSTVSTAVQRPVSQRLSSLAAPPQPTFDAPPPPPAAPAATPLRIDTSRTSLDQGNSGDMTPPSERMSNGSWLPPLPRLTGPMIGNESSEGLPTRHSFLQVADGTEIQVSPRSDSLRGGSVTSGSTFSGSKRASERSSVSMTSTRATSPDPHSAPHNGQKVEEEEEEQHTNTEEYEELEQNMLEKTYAHELVFNKEGQITGGTLPALVEKLTTADSTPDPTFVSTFYLTFRLFATPVAFAQSLIDRFTYSSESQVVASPVQLRVYNVFKGWLEGHWRIDADEAALEMVVAFASGPLSQVLPNAGRHLIDLANKANDNSSRLANNVGKTNVSLASFAAAAMPIPSPSISKSQTNMLKAWRDGKAMPSIVDFEPMELARQFTLKVSSVFCGILPEELLGTEWTKKSGSVAVSVRAMSTLSTDLANLVADCILGQEDAGKRAKIIKQWVKIAKCCLELQNYDSLIAIVCSLNSTTILRLKKTWDAVSQKTKATLTQLNTVIDCSKNYSQLRGMLAGSAPPCLPFLGMYLTDLTFVDAGNPNSRNTPDGTKLINFDKHVKTARIISELQRFQIPYRFQDIPEMQTWIQEQLIRVRSNEAAGQGGGQAYYRRSLLLEPRLDTKVAGAPSPAMSQGGWSPVDDKPKGGMKDFQSMLRGVMKRENSNQQEGSRRPSITQE